jgi:signal transduction histidine kinase
MKMLSYRKLRIKHKLQAIIMAVVVPALLLSCAAFATYDLVALRNSLKRDLRAQAEIVGSNINAALGFADQKAAEEILSGLQAKPNIVAAYVYSSDGKLFAVYQRAGARNHGSVPQLRPQEIRLESDRLVVLQPIQGRDGVIGSLYLESDLREMRERIKRFSTIIGVILLVALLAALGLSLKLQEVISAPILQLAQAARAVSAKGDYAIRAVKANEDELGNLVDDFNHMLEQIQRQDDELRRYRDHLQEEVTARTAELMAAEVELRHAQKLESVGRLASGIAHEINTPIQFIGDNTRFLQGAFTELTALLAKYRALVGAAAPGAVSPGLIEEVRQAEVAADVDFLVQETPKGLEQTMEGVERVATIVRAMKDFAHVDRKEKSATDVNRALLSTLTVARNELKYVSNVETEFGDLPLLVGNVSDLNQVFLNLLVNAAHAIGDVVKGTGQKGLIRVRTSVEEGAVVISIADTGCGIPEDIRDKIFDPFFTTKEIGRGTGQGLAIAHSIVVEKHGGTITFTSEVGKGTTFSIRLPLGEEAKPAEGNHASYPLPK